MEDKKTKPEPEKCVICENDIKGYGNNPSPVKEEGKCCDRCNMNEVLPARLARIGVKI